MPFVSVVGTDGVDGVTTLTLEEGVRMEFLPPADLRIGSTSGSGPPGRLVSDGAPGALVQMTSSVEPPAVGDWVGIRVRQTGSAFLRSTAIRYAATAVSVEAGTLETFEDVALSPAGTGLQLDNATLLATIDGLETAGTATSVASFNSTPVIRNSNLLGTLWGVRNDSPAFVVDARENCWGSPDGPSGAGPGSGSAASAGVLFDPWCTSAGIPALPVWGVALLAAGLALVVRRSS
jgi:hypothetical protein